MTNKQFSDWLERLKNAWETKNPGSIVDLCSEEVLWYETPFSKPLKTKGDILKEWQSVLNQENISISYKILCISENLGIAQWLATFTKLPSKQRVVFDGIFQISLNERGECVEFHQWFNSKEQ